MTSPSWILQYFLQDFEKYLEPLSPYFDSKSLVRLCLVFLSAEPPRVGKAPSGVHRWCVLAHIHFILLFFFQLWHSWWLSIRTSSWLETEDCCPAKRTWRACSSTSRGGSAGTLWAMPRPSFGCWTGHTWTLTWMPSHCLGWASHFSS